MAASAWSPVPPDQAGWTPVPQAEQADTRNAIQKSFDSNTAPKPNETLLQKGIRNTVAAAGAPFVHPVDTIMGLLLPKDFATQYKEAQQQPKQSLAAGLAEGGGQFLGGLAAGAVTGEAVRAATPAIASGLGRVAAATGEAATDAGTRLMNNTVGTLKADFKRGANPARGYLATGNGPAISMASLADKASSAVETTADKLGSAYKAADAAGKIIPASDVANAVAGPMREAFDVATGVGAPKGLLNDLIHHASTFRDVLAKGQEQGGFTPSQVWKIKRDLAKATSWSDPTQIGLKSVTQQQVGALSGVLQEAVPETTELNQNYMDLLKMAGRAEERANTGSRPLTAHIYKAGLTAAGALAGSMEGNALLGAAVGTALDSVPAKTTLATSLFRGGRALSDAGQRFAARGSVIPEQVAPNDLGGNGANYKTGNPQLPPPGPPELSASPNATTVRGLSSGNIPPQLPASTPGYAPTPPSPPPPLNQATARMRVQPTQFNPQPTPTPPSAPRPVSPSGQVGTALEPKGLPAPAPNAPKLTGKALWAQKGGVNLEAHGVSAADVDSLAQTARGKQLLVIASGLTPGSPAMKNLVQQIKALQK